MQVRGTAASSLVPGFKTVEGGWETKGHPNRLVSIGLAELATFNLIMEESGTETLASRLPNVHSKEILSVLRKVSEAPLKLGDQPHDYYSTMMINETTGQHSGLIDRADRPSFQPRTPGTLVLSGPHFFVGTPFSKSPRTSCTHNNAYDSIYLTDVGSDYIPRSVYKPGADVAELENPFLKAASNWPTASSPSAATRFRHVNRVMVQPTNERTLISAMMPKSAAHISAVFSVCFNDDRRTQLFNALTCSICFDLIVKVSGKTNCRNDVMDRLPLTEHVVNNAIVNRGLRLNCISESFSELWCSVATDLICVDRFTCERSLSEFELPWSKLDKNEWVWKSPLRSDFARRQGLLEIDVLVAFALGLTIDELLTIYRVQFPIMRMYEIADEFDSRGFRLPNTIRKDQGGTQFRTARVTAAQHFPEAYKSRTAFDAHSPDWPFADETSIPLDQARRVPDIPEFASIHRYVAARNKYGDQLATLELEEPNTDGPPSPDFTPHRIRQLESVYGTGRVPLMLDVSWEIDDGLQTLSKTFYPPFTKVDREEDYRRAWEEFSRRYSTAKEEVATK